MTVLRLLPVAILDCATCGTRSLTPVPAPGTMEVQSLRCAACDRVVAVLVEEEAA
jgi:hypothetical protein